MAKGKFMIVITGPTGAGKSTVAQRLAKEIENSVNIDVDHVKHFIVTGFKYDQSPAGIEQWKLLGKNLGLLAKNFQDFGCNVIVNGYINFESWPFILDKAAFTHKFLILPALDKAIERDRGRDKDSLMGEEAVRTHHQNMSTNKFYKDFMKLDSSHHTIDETVSNIREILNKP